MPADAFKHAMGLHMSHHRSLGSYARAYVMWRIVHELVHRAEGALKRQRALKSSRAPLVRAPELAPGMRVRLFMQVGSAQYERGTVLAKHHAPGYWTVQWDDEDDTRTVHVSRLWPAEKGE